MTTSVSHTVRNIIYGVCFGLFISNFAVLIIRLWDRDSPGAPDLAHGLIYPHIEHGVTLYYSAVQALTESIPFWRTPIFILAFLGLLISPKKDMKPRFFGLNFIHDDPHKIGMITVLLTTAIVLAALFLAGPQILNFLLAHGINPLTGRLS